MWCRRNVVNKKEKKSIRKFNKGNSDNHNSDDDDEESFGYGREDADNNI